MSFSESSTTSAVGPPSGACVRTRTDWTFVTALVTVTEEDVNLTYGSSVPSGEEDEDRNPHHRLANQIAPGNFGAFWG